MAYICPNPENYNGQKVGNGHCVVFVQHCAKEQNTFFWKRGEKVRGNMSLAKGTAIATFDKNGKYPNKANGNYAAIYVGQMHLVSGFMISG